MNQYSYDGPVMSLNTCVATRWQGYTHAISEAKARSNLAFQFKKLTGKLPNTKISLPGKLEIIQ